MFIVLFVFVVAFVFAFVCVYVLDWWSSGNGFHRTLLAEQWCCPMWNEIRFHFVWKSSNIHQRGHITWILPRSPGPTWPWSWWPPQQPPPRPTPDCSKPTRGQPSSLTHRFIWKRSRPMRMLTNTEPRVSILFSAAILRYFRWLSGEKQGWVLCVWLGGGACGRPAVSSSSELGAPTAQPHTQPGEVEWDNLCPAKAALLPPLALHRESRVQVKVATTESGKPNQNIGSGFFQKWRMADQEEATTGNTEEGSGQPAMVVEKEGCSIYRPMMYHLPLFFQPIK